MKRRFGFFVWMVATGLLFGMGLPASAGEGFGMLKKTANLTRIHPPQVFIAGRTISIRVTSTGNRYAMAAQRLQSQLESELLGNNTRLKLETADPDTTVDVNILQDDYNSEWVQREGIRMVKTNRVDSKGKPIYEEQRVQYRVKIVKHTFGTSFKVHDRRADRSLVADTTNRPFSSEYMEGNGAPDEAWLENDGIRGVVNDLTHRLAPTKEIVGVLIPRGSLENVANLAYAGLWSKYLDSLQKMTPLAKPTDEAYRQYALGVAYEALGYGADDVDTSLKYLEQASVHYNNAVDANPKESYFMKAYQSILFSSKSAAAPMERVQQALVQYQRVKEFEDSTSSTLSGYAVGSKGSKGGGTSSGGGITNADVVEMLRAGLSEDVILTSISSAPQTAFDITPKGLIQLAEAKASKKLIQQIQTTASTATKRKP